MSSYRISPQTFLWDRLSGNRFKSFSGDGVIILNLDLDISSLKFPYLKVILLLLNTIHQNFSLPRVTLEAESQGLKCFG